MHSRFWKAGTMSILALAAALPAQAGIEQQQLQAVKALASIIFNDPPGVTEPANPCQAIPPCGCPAPPNDTACKCDQLFTGTPNQKLLARTWYYGWALRNDPNSVSCARTQLLSHLSSQQTWGHYSLNASTDEALTSSHFQLWSGGMAAAYLFALTSGKAWTFIPRTTDTTVITEVRRWWLDEKVLWDAIANGGTQIDAPGARFPTTENPPYTNNTYRNLVYAELKGPWPQSVPNQWATDQYYTGGWIFDKLFQLGHDPKTNVVAPISGYTPKVRLHDTFCIYRPGTPQNGQWLYYFPKLQTASDPVFWVQNRPGELHSLASVGGVPINPPVKPANFSTSFAPIPYIGLAPGAIACPPSNAF